MMTAKRIPIPPARELNDLENHNLLHNLFQNGRLYRILAATRSPSLVPINNVLAGIKTDHGFYCCVHRIMLKTVCDVAHFTNGGAMNQYSFIWKFWPWPGQMASRSQITPMVQYGAIDLPD
jgi:hypothetical protein